MKLLLAQRKQRRHGVAAVELAVVLPFLIMTLFALWEVGRIIEVQQILDNAAREGARLSASGSWTASNAHPSMNLPSADTDYEVQRKTLAYIQAAGLQTTNATVQVNNITRNYNYTYTAGGGFGTTIATPGTDPAANANSTTISYTPGQPFPPPPPPDTIEVTVTMPYDTIAWKQMTFTSFFPATLQAKVSWRSSRNVPLQFNTTIPQNPIP